MPDNNELGDIVPYNTSTGAMILLQNKNKFYSWSMNRVPKKLNFNDNADKRKKRRRNRSKRKNRGDKMNDLKPYTDKKLPLVKIMQGGEIVCPGVIIHSHFILASAHCVQNMTGLYIYHQNNMSIDQAYIFNQQSSHQLAIIKTISELKEQKICFENQG